MPEWEGVSQEARGWIASTLTDSASRMTAAQARAHPWLAEAVEGERRRAERRERIRAHHQQQGEGGLALGEVAAPHLKDREKDGERERGKEREGEREREQGRSSLSSAAMTDHSTHSTSSSGTAAGTGAVTGTETGTGTGIESKGRKRANTSSTGHSSDDTSRGDRPRCTIS